MISRASDLIRGAVNLIGQASDLIGGAINLIGQASDLAGRAINLEGWLINFVGEATDLVKGVIDLIGKTSTGFFFILKRIDISASKSLLHRGSLNAGLASDNLPNHTLHSGKAR